MLFGRCDCCLGPMHTGGCPSCSIVRTYCGCGDLIRCGCGKSVQHQCHSFVVVPAAVITMPAITIPAIVIRPMWPAPSCLPEGFITETGVLLN